MRRKGLQASRLGVRVDYADMSEGPAAAVRTVGGPGIDVGHARQMAKLVFSRGESCGSAQKKHRARCAAGEGGGRKQRLLWPSSKQRHNDGRQPTKATPNPRTNRARLAGHSSRRRPCRASSCRETAALAHDGITITAALQSPETAALAAGILYSPRPRLTSQARGYIIHDRPYVCTLAAHAVRRLAANLALHHPPTLAPSPAHACHGLLSNDAACARLKPRVASSCHTCCLAPESGTTLRQTWHHASNGCTP